MTIYEHLKAKYPELHDFKQTYLGFCPFFYNLNVECLSNDSEEWRCKECWQRPYLPNDESKTTNEFVNNLNGIELPY